MRLTTPHFHPDEFQSCAALTASTPITTRPTPSTSGSWRARATIWRRAAPTARRMAVAGRPRRPRPSPLVDHRSVRDRARSRWQAPTAGSSITFNGEIYNFQALRDQLDARGPSLPQPLRHRGAAAPLCGERAGAWCAICAACSPSRSGTPSSARCSWRAIPTASSRSTTPTTAGRSGSPRRSRRCSPAAAFRATPIRRARSASTCSAMCPSRSPLYRDDPRLAGRARRSRVDRLGAGAPQRYHSIAAGLLRRGARQRRPTGAMRRSGARGAARQRAPSSGRRRSGRRLSVGRRRFRRAARPDARRRADGCPDASRWPSRNSAARPRTKRRWPPRSRAPMARATPCAASTTPSSSATCRRSSTAMDQPSIDGINTWFVAKAAREPGLKVAISGLGGDELFGGYPSFRDMPRWVRLVRPLGPRVPLARRGFRAHGRRARSVPLGVNRRRRGCSNMAALSRGAYLLRRGVFMPWELHEAAGAAKSSREGLRRLDPSSTWSAIFSPTRRHAAGRVCGARIRALHAQPAAARHRLGQHGAFARSAHAARRRELLQSMARIAAACRRTAGKAMLAQAPDAAVPDARAARPRPDSSTPIARWQTGSARRSRATEMPPREPRARAWAGVVQATRPKVVVAAVNILALVTDAFGGYGGIAQYNRDLFARAWRNSPRAVPRPRAAAARRGSGDGLPPKARAQARAAAVARRLFAAARSPRPRAGPVRSCLLRASLSSRRWPRRSAAGPARGCGCRCMASRPGTPLGALTRCAVGPRRLDDRGQPLHAAPPVSLGRCRTGSRARAAEHRRGRSSRRAPPDPAMPRAIGLAGGQVVLTVRGSIRPSATRATTGSSRLCRRSCAPAAAPSMSSSATATARPGLEALARPRRHDACASSAVSRRRAAVDLVPARPTCSSMPSAQGRLRHRVRRGGGVRPAGRRWRSDGSVDALADGAIGRLIDPTRAPRSPPP